MTLCQRRQAKQALSTVNVLHLLQINTFSRESRQAVFLLLLTYFCRNLASFYASYSLQFHLHFGLSSICLYYPFTQVPHNVTYFHILHIFFFLYLKSVKAYNISWSSFFLYFSKAFLCCSVSYLEKYHKLWFRSVYHPSFWHALARIKSKEVTIFVTAGTF